MFGFRGTINVDGNRYDITLLFANSFSLILQKLAMYNGIKFKPHQKVVKGHSSPYPRPQVRKESQSQPPYRFLLHPPVYAKSSVFTYIHMYMYVMQRSTLLLFFFLHERYCIHISLPFFFT